MIELLDLLCCHPLVRVFLKVRRDKGAWSDTYGLMADRKSAKETGGKMRRSLSLTLVALAMAFGVALSAGPAMAGGNCDSHLDQSGSYYRAGASCSSLTGDSEARAQLARYWGPDYYSQWFNDLFVTYHSGWYTCWQGCYDAVQIS